MKAEISACIFSGCCLASLLLQGCASPVALADQGNHACERRLRLVERRVELARTADHLKTTPLHLAIRDGDTELALFILGRRPSAAKELDGDGPRGSNALAVAANENNLTLVRALLDAGASPNASWQKPLIAAARLGSLEIVRALVEAGADVNARDLGDMEGEVTALFVARDVRVTEYLLAHGADVNRRPRSGMTALMLATWEQDLARVEVLVKYGADLSLRDRRGKTAMDYAREKGGDEVIERLRARGAKRSSELH